VVKIKDAIDALTPEERETLAFLAARVQKYHKVRASKPLVCLVVEDDWPEYEPTWKAIEARVSGTSDNG
jgi:hypothetical protein